MLFCAVAASISIEVESEREREREREMRGVVWKRKDSCEGGFQVNAEKGGS